MVDKISLKELRNRLSNLENFDENCQIGVDNCSTIYPPYITYKIRDTIFCIVYRFETGRFYPDYSSVTLVPGDRGGLSYGIIQFSWNSGTLQKLLDIYIQKKGALSTEIKAKLKLPNIQFSTTFHDLLRKAGKDPIMKLCQDEIRDQKYFIPGIKVLDTKKFKLPLTLAVIVDSLVHGSFGYINARVKGTDEKSWVRKYVAVRKNWLATHSNTLLRKTVYRMNFFEQELTKENWMLNLPITVQGRILEKVIAWG